MGSIDGGWLFVLGLGVLGVGSCYCVYPICESARRWALWSSYVSVYVFVIMLFSLYCLVVGRASEKKERYPLQEGI